MWDFKGTLWNSTQNILPIHWKIWFLYNIEILRALSFKSSYTFLKHTPGMSHQKMHKWSIRVGSHCWDYSPSTLSCIEVYATHLMIEHWLIKSLGAGSPDELQSRNPKIGHQYNGPWFASPTHTNCHIVLAWASCQIHIIADCACAGNAGNVFPAPRVSDPDMHHGTCMMHMPFCMPGSLTSSFLCSQLWRKHSLHSRRMCNPQFCVSGKRPIALQIIASRPLMRDHLLFKTPLAVGLYRGSTDVMLTSQYRRDTFNNN